MSELKRENKREQTKEASSTVSKTAESSGVCPHCGAHVEAGSEFCPVCGTKLVDYCTFCGAPMRPDDADCPECGLPAEGIVCPKCGIKNHRSFCGQCGEPLSRAARRAVDKAKQDPKVQEVARLMMHIAELEAELDSNHEVMEEPTEPTEGELRLKALMAKVGFTPAEKPEAKRRKLGRSRKEIMEEYQKAVEDSIAAMESMLPPAGMTPQEQRNYFTARKVAVMETVEITWRGVPMQDSMAWECNWCKVLHNNPCECERQDLGGKWVPCKKCRVVERGGQLFTTNVEKKVYKRL